MQTHGTGMDAVGLRAGAAAFCDTGRQLVARGGLGALFVGLAPRLAHQVPGELQLVLLIQVYCSMLVWMHATLCDVHIAYCAHL